LFALERRAYERARIARTNGGVHDREEAAAKFVRLLWRWCQ
jgi:hypothetical protein